MIKKIWLWIQSIFSDYDDPNEPSCDPAHIASMLVLTLFGISILFWLFWSLLVYKGGLVGKIIPFLKVVFTSKILADYGYQGYPYEMGIFDGWVTNAVAFLFLCFLIFVVSKKLRGQK